MVPGFNHNICYKGALFHIQTEDSGLDKPQITTLLFLDGTIIASKKTDYSDILRVDMLDKVVEDLMKEQHKEMLRRLKGGEFDGRAFDSTEAGIPPEETTTTLVHPPINENQPPPPRPFRNPRPGQTLDDIIFEYLASDND